MRGYNNNSIHGLKGRSANCCQIAMDNLDLRPSYRYRLPSGGTYTLSFLSNVRAQATLVPIYSLGEKLMHIPLGDEKIERRVKKLGYPTAYNFALAHRTGFYLLLVRGHVMVVRNGRVFNGPNSKTQIILGAYRVKPKSGKGKAA